MLYTSQCGGQGKANNDYVFYRYADVLLMKAEALLRTAALQLPNHCKPCTSKSRCNAIASVTLDHLLDERQREFYWDGWRRQDLIRFGNS